MRTYHESIDTPEEEMAMRSWRASMLSVIELRRGSDDDDFEEDFDIDEDEDEDDLDEDEDDDDYDDLEDELGDDDEPRTGKRRREWE